MSKDLEKQSDFIFYRSQDGNINIQVIVGDETVWTTQKSMSEIFNVESNTITYHLGEIYKSHELQKVTTTRKIRVVQREGSRNVKREIDFYNLDVIIAVGYRVNSYEATQFRIWATNILKEYLIKGFAIDDERLKQGTKVFGKDYFDELLEKIREIRASERRFYQKITDIYAQCSIDYDSQSAITKGFYATVQNKLHWAITKHTAAEIIKLRANSEKTNMGLTTWKNAPEGKILKSDVKVAKNYLNEDEISELNLIVNMYLDYAELQTKRQNAMKMVDWIKKLDSFLTFNDYTILTNPGKVSANVAKAIAEKEFEKFRIQQDTEYESDFDKVVSNITEKHKLPTESKPIVRFSIKEQLAKKQKNNKLDDD
jgi:hypothetical protein